MPRFSHTLLVLAVSLLPSLTATFGLPTPALATGTVAHTDIEVPPEAFGVGSMAADGHRVEARLLVDVTAAHPGQTITLGVLFSMHPNWHIYWHNSGQAGLPTRLTLETEGATLGDIAWPAPEVFSESGGFIVTYGYDGEVLLQAPLTLPADAAGSQDLTVTANWLACESSCIPGEASLTRTIEIIDAAQTPSPAAPEVVALFDAYASRVPDPAEQHGLTIEVAYSQSVIRPDDEFRVAIGVIACAGPPAEGEACPVYRFPGEEPVFAFIPERSPFVDLEVTATRAHPAAYAGHVVELTGFANPDEPEGPERLAGVVYLIDEGDEPIAAVVDVPIPVGASGDEVTAVQSAMWDEAPTEPVAEEGSGGAEAAGQANAVPVSEGAAPVAPITLWRALLLALLGGLILNVMPCVLPVLALKVHGFIALGQQEVYGEGESGPSVHASLLAYVAGVLCPMWLMVGAMIAVRTAGGFVGWGQQMQYPVFISIAGGIVGAFSLNLFGVFHISMSAGSIGERADESTGLRRSFLEGVITVILATPCSAPFLGSAVGYALIAGSNLDIFLIFTAVGLGLVAPFATLVMIPGWVKVLPKPGMWMERFKQFVGFSFLGGVLWLAWVVGKSYGYSGMTRFLLFILAVSFGMWLIGVAQEAGRRIWAFGGVALAIVVGTGLLTLQFDEGAAAGSHGAAAAILGASGAGGAEGTAGAWRPYDEAAIAAELADGRPVFVDFTADWCTTCKTVERFVLGADPVQAALVEYDVATFIADWTRPDPVITEALRSYGRAGVPLYLVYSPSRPARAAVLPETPTIEMVVEALRAAAEGSI